MTDEMVKSNWIVRGNYMANKFDFTQDIEALIQRVTPMLDEIDLENYEWQAWDMDYPEKQRSQAPEIIQKYMVLHEQKKINVSEYRRLLHLELKSKNEEV